MEKNSPTQKQAPIRAFLRRMGEGIVQNLVAALLLSGVPVIAASLLDSEWFRIGASVSAALMVIVLVFWIIDRYVWSLDNMAAAPAIRGYEATFPTEPAGAPPKIASLLQEGEVVVKRLREFAGTPMPNSTREERYWAEFWPLVHGIETRLGEYEITSPRPWPDTGPFDAENVRGVAHNLNTMLIKLRERRG